MMDLNEVRKAHGPLKSQKFSKSPLIGKFSKMQELASLKMKLTSFCPLHKVLISRYFKGTHHKQI
jgi:hypothetical protein